MTGPMISNTFMRVLASLFCSLHRRLPNFLKKEMRRAEHLLFILYLPASPGRQ